MTIERQPLYVQIQEYFKNRIQSQELKSHDKIPPEKELMQQFNVSRITVVNALVQLAKEGWIYRVPGRGSFVSESSNESVQGVSGASSSVTENIATDSPTFASGLEGKERRSIGLILPAIIDHFALRLIEGVSRKLTGEDYPLHITLTNNSREREKEAIQKMLQIGVKGLLIFPCDAETYNEEILSLKANGFPFVLLDRYFPGIETNIVRSDGFIGGKMAVDYLWKHGHRNIAICSDTILPTITVEDRVAGYMESLKQHGTLINPALILTDFNVDYKKNDETHPLYRFIKNHMATAYITLNGRLGVHIVSICRSLGLEIPKDVSVLTFDNPGSGLVEDNWYSHISQSETMMGEQATQILLDVIEGRQETGCYVKTVMEPNLVIRQSTGRVSQ
ncbi:GntR family transcriptional regulator [Paenibacillus sp. J5C_2022]|uniref:GntR family transcriptional regulator n=1 Tax=Paenibacillus sp. J5C2022 TaxID=2977129 RepID=UPI0021D12C3D|nr:GntR family transcriptional regulator [Paenibacillus sp. J5C2022]MCU6708054.1 GntR family transcriptional regulator [Paenibacillus sp. J5C2022]